MSKFIRVHELTDIELSLYASHYVIGKFLDILRQAGGSVQHLEALESELEKRILAFTQTQSGEPSRSDSAADAQGIGT